MLAGRFPGPVAAALIAAFVGLAGADPVLASPPELDSRLAQLARVDARSGALAVARAATASGVRADSRGVEVVIETRRRSASAVDRALRAAGARDVRAYRNLRQASVPTSALDRLAAIDGVRVRPPHRPSPQSLEGMGPMATGAAAWLGAGVQGAGVKVAVIDVGFWNWRDRVAEGDLPASTTLQSYCDGAEYDTHGTGMGETVHDEAPLAELMLICIDTDVELGIAKDYARDHGADIVVSALSFFGTGRGDGSGGPSTPEGIAADASASGMLWVAAAGNQAMQHWGGNFTDTDGDHWHEWSGTDETQWPILDPPERLGCFYLRWDDWPTTTRDLDLYAYRYSDGALLASSENPQRLGGLPPTETLCVQGSSAGVELKVLDRSAQIADGGCTRRCTPTVLPPVRIDFDYDWEGAEVHRAGLEHHTAGRSLAEPAAVPEVLAVGAFCVRTGDLEPFSSRGPTPDGRTKPDLAAPDGDLLATPVYNYDGTCQSAGFRGTSAAAAATAGIAAAAKSVLPDATPAELKAYLIDRAADAGPAGSDNDWGAGRIRLRAFADVPSSAAYAGASEELYRRGIVRPRARGRLEPDAAVTRAEMAEYILRAMDHAGHLPSYRGYYTDMPAGDPRTPWVEHLREHGIADVTGGAYRPGDAITHAEAAGFLGRAAPGAELPPNPDPAAPLTRAELMLWVAAAWDMRWWKHLHEGLVDDSVIVGDRIWFTDEGDNTVNSYNFLTGAVETPIAVGSRPREIDATPDGGKLVVTNIGSYDVSVIDATSRSELRRVAIPRGNFAETPRSVATAANGTALVATTTLYYSGYTSHIYTLDPDTGELRLRTDLAAYADFGTTSEVTYLSPSLDRSRIFTVEGNSSAGHVVVYDSATDSKVGVGTMGDFVGYVAGDRDGDTVVVGPDLTLLHGNGSTDHALGEIGFGTAISPGGTRLFSAGAGGLRVFDLASDALLTTLPLGDSVSDALWRNYIYTPVTRSAMDPAGRTVSVVTNQGLTILPTGFTGNETDRATADRDPPAVAITSGPSGTTSSTSATFTFASDEPGRFQCGLDDGLFGGCAETTTFSGLTTGTHTLVVRAVDVAGNPSPKASRTWTVGDAATDPPPAGDPPPSEDPPPSGGPAPSGDPAPSGSDVPAPGTNSSGPSATSDAPQPLAVTPAAPDEGERTAGPAVPVRPHLLRRPRIRGLLTPEAGLTADPGTWSGSPPLRTTVSWRRCDAKGGRCRTIAHGRRYRVRDADRGHTLRAVVAARGPGGSAKAVSPPRAVR